MFNNADPLYHVALVVLERNRSLHAAERHEHEAALRDIADRRRREQKERRRGRLRRHRADRRTRPTVSRAA